MDTDEVTPRDLAPIPRTYGPAVDMGAYEIYIPPPPLPDPEPVLD